MVHRANADFWNDYRALPADVRARADKQFALLKANPQHPSLQLKKIGERSGEEIWSARVTLKYRALAVRLADEYVWFWIGSTTSMSPSSPNLRAFPQRVVSGEALRTTTDTEKLAE